MKPPVVVLGGGGHARVVLDVLMEVGRQVLGYTVEVSNAQREPLYGVPCLASDDTLQSLFGPNEIELANGLGSTGPIVHRKRVFEQFNQLGYRFATILHPSATISRFAELGEGVQVMAGAVLQPSCSVGRNTIVNSRASIDHDCFLGEHVHVAPGVTLSGGVTVGNRTHIGTGATVIQGIRIGADCLIGAGSVIICDVPDGAVVVGVPGRERAK